MGEASGVHMYSVMPFGVYGAVFCLLFAMCV